MKFPSLLLVLPTLLLAACAESSLSTPGNPDNPPVTMSGYVESSYTSQVK